MVNFIKSDHLNAAPTIRHGFFGRSGGVSTNLYASLNCRRSSNDDPERIEKNRSLACAALSKDARLFAIRQVHSPTVHVFDGDFTAPEADAVVTDQKNIALSVLTADCAPVLLADHKAGVIAAAHSGWRGAVGGVLENTVAAMVDLGATLNNICAAIGPCIAQKSYEVGKDVYEQVANEQFFKKSTREDHFLFDLEGYVAHRLNRSGVINVDPLHTDTYDKTNDFFSYRRRTHLNEEDYGCQISIILQH